AWDRTTGLNGGVANASAGGETTAFSAATETASILLNPLPAWFLSEMLFDAPGGDGGQEYLELRGTPNAVIPQGTYFIHLEGDSGGPNGGPGVVHAYIDLGGLTFGSKGYLVLAQDITRY